METGHVDLRRRVGIGRLGAGLDDLDAGHQALAPEATQTPDCGAACTGRRPSSRMCPNRSALGDQASPSRRISRLAIAAATGSGEAEWVEVIEPGGYSSMMSARPITAEIGSDDVMPLPQAIRSGVMP